MKVLHVAGGFARHSLYTHLVQHLRDVCQFQSVFAPVRSADELSHQPPDEPDVLVYDYRQILKPFHRLLFRTKIRTIHREMCRSIDPTDFTLIHAHTLYSDGAVALRMRKSFRIPYIVAIRNTDINVFMRFRPDLRWIARAVLLGASRIVFLSPAYRKQFLSHLNRSLREEVEKKSVVLANGLDLFWLETFSRPERGSESQLRILYVGNFTDNKNVHGVLHATAELTARIPAQLTLVGRSNRRIRNEIATGKYPFARIHGRVDDLHELRSLYRSHDIFVMPSFKETFGVAYIEALSQGLPIVHSRGQGMDGFFQPGTVSEAVDPRDVHSIATGIELLAARMEQVRPICIGEAHKFSWRSIALQYKELYRTIAAG